MNYVVTGSLGHISKPLAKKLLAEGHKVTIVSSKEDKRKEIESLGATAAIGSVEDVSFLTNTFKGADALYTMIPPTYTPKDWKKHIANMGANYAQAVRNAGVKYVVNLSSIGAHLPEGCGPVSGLHFAEKSLNELNDVNVLHLRPGFFYYNLLGLVGMAKNAGILGGNYGTNATITFADTDDIADVAAKELLRLSFTGKSHRYVVSDERTTTEVANAIGSAIQKPELPWIDFSDEDNYNGLVQAGLPDEISRNYTEMGSAMRSGKMTEDYFKNKPALAGKKKLEDFAKDFQRVYNQN